MLTDVHGMALDLHVELVTDGVIGSRCFLFEDHGALDHEIPFAQEGHEVDGNVFFLVGFPVLRKAETLGREGEALAQLIEGKGEWSAQSDAIVKASNL